MKAEDVFNALYLNANFNILMLKFEKKHSDFKDLPVNLPKY